MRSIFSIVCRVVDCMKLISVSYITEIEKQRDANRATCVYNRLLPKKRIDLRLMKQQRYPTSIFLSCVYVTKAPNVHV